MSFSLLLYRNQKKQPTKVNDEKPTNSDTTGMVTNAVKCHPHLGGPSTLRFFGFRSFTAGWYTLLGGISSNVSYQLRTLRNQRRTAHHFRSYFCCGSSTRDFHQAQVDFRCLLRTIWTEGVYEQNPTSHLKHKKQRNMVGAGCVDSWKLF